MPVHLEVRHATSLQLYFNTNTRRNPTNVYQLPTTQQLIHQRGTVPATHDVIEPPMLHSPPVDGGYLCAPGGAVGIGKLY